MPYKIYTYADPYRIRDADFWPEISNVPHLCSSRTLVNGLVNVMQDGLNCLICPIDDIINDYDIYGDWTKNIARQLQQYSFLTKQFDYLYKIKRLDESFYKSLNHNKASMLDSIRLFIELGLSAESLHKEYANREQQLFIWLLRKVQKLDRLGDGSFCFPQAFTLRKLHQVLTAKAEEEKMNFKQRTNSNLETPLYKSRLALYDREISSTKSWNGQKLVVHGIHQFTPVQLRFILAAERSGIEIIFLYNFQEKYSTMYASWNYIYQYFGATVHQDKNVPTYTLTGQMPTAGHALGESLALMCESGFNKADPHFRHNYALYKNFKIQRFDNVSEYAGYISDQVEKTKKNLEIKNISHQPYQKQKTSDVLSEMQELTYTTNKDVDDLLQLYYPEYARTRHFLSYPIGKFFSSLYNLWDNKNKAIRIEYSLIRECLNSGVLTSFSPVDLLKTALNLKPLFENVSTYNEFMYRLKAQYLVQYDEVTKHPSTFTASGCKAMAIYNSDKVKKKDITNLATAISELNNIANELFSTQSNTEGTFSFGKHFEKMEKFIHERREELQNANEQDLIDALLSRLEDVKNTATENKMEGTFEDLKSGIYYFLKQKEEPDPNWLVKNFEQIDGDILISKVQNRPGKSKTYHFACVSDRDMNQSINEILPWPLTDQFIEKAYTPIDLQFQVYYAALSERSNFLRYSLFFGLFYNQCDSKISYVRNRGEDATEALDLLRLLGVKEEPYSHNLDKQNLMVHTTTAVMHQPGIPDYQLAQMQAMFLCPYRYFFDYVLNSQPIISGDYLYENLFVNILIENVWKRIQNLPIEQAKMNCHEFLTQEAYKLEPFFSFWKASDFPDMIRKAENYINDQIINSDVQQKRNTIRPCDDRHMESRKHFFKVKYEVDPSDWVVSSPYEDFISLRKEDKGKFVYSLNQLPKDGKCGSPQVQALLKSTADYLSQSMKAEERVGPWCTYCADKEICLRCYTVSG